MANAVAFPSSPIQTPTSQLKPILTQRAASTKPDNAPDPNQETTGRMKTSWWKDITSSERDLLVASTVLKVLLFPT